MVVTIRNDQRGSSAGGHVAVAEANFTEGLRLAHDESRAGLVDVISSGVVSKLSDTSDNGAVRQLVVQELARFDDARITDFIPLLVERAVLRRLRERPVVTGGTEQ